MPGRAVKPTAPVSTRAGPSSRELANGSSPGFKASRAGAAVAGVRIDSVGADAAPANGAGVVVVLGGAVPMATTSGAPVLSLLVATISAATPAMLSVASAIRPFVADEAGDVRRRGELGSRAESRRMGCAAAGAAMSESFDDSRLGRDVVRGDSPLSWADSMTDNVSSLWPLGPLLAPV